MNEFSPGFCPSADSVAVCVHVPVNPWGHGAFAQRAAHLSGRLRAGRPFGPLQAGGPVQQVPVAVVKPDGALTQHVLGDAPGAGRTEDQQRAEGYLRTETEHVRRRAAAPRQSALPLVHRQHYRL